MKLVVNSLAITSPARWILFIILSATCLSQTRIDLNSQARSVDFRQASATLPVQTGSTLPATCTVGALYFLTTVSPGANLYACAATNTWIVESGVAASSGSGAPSGSCSAASVYNDTQNVDTWFCENGAWQKLLTTADTGPFVMTGQTGASPAAPTTGTDSLFFNYPARVAQSIDDTGGIATMVRPTDCSTGGQVVQIVNADGTISCSAASVTHAIGFTFDGGGTALPSGITKYLTVPFACTIEGWNIAVDTGTATIATWKTATGNGVPTASNSVSISGVSISSGTAVHSSNTSDFTTTAISADDVLGFNLAQVSAATQVNFVLECLQ